MSGALAHTMAFHCDGAAKPFKRRGIDGVASGEPFDTVSSTRRAVARDCRCTAGTVCRHNSACPRLPGRGLHGHAEG